MEKLVIGVERLGLKLTTKQLDQFELFYSKMSKWNQKVNLTTITDYQEVQIKHFLDSLTVIQAFHHLMKTPPERVIDIGTGAGFPGIPLKILIPAIQLTLVDSITKKTAFLEYITEKLELKNTNIVTTRAEELGHNEHYREQFDLVLSRSVASLPTLLELTLPFCMTGGIFVSQKLARVKPEIDRATKAMRVLGGRLKEIIPILLPESTDKRCLVIFDKISPTPDEYPRRPGIPMKRPIVYL